jgi:Nucleotide modification associated domain 3
LGEAVSVAKARQQKSVRDHQHVYLVNVGVNLAHKLRSPLFPDARFEFVPIPEEGDLGESIRAGIKPITYGDLFCHNSSQKLLSLFSQKLQDEFANRLVHYDPNFNNANDACHATFTYGDIPYTNARASSLRYAQPGDLLFFLANLAQYDCDSASFIRGQRALYLIGFIEIDTVLEYIPEKKLLYDHFSDHYCDVLQFSKNAHVKRLLTLSYRFERQPFMIFEGSDRSRRFEYAVRISRQLCDLCVRDKENRPFDYSKFRSLDACIGAYTRAVRPHFKLNYREDRLRFHSLLEHITTFNDVPNFVP